jgi:protoheme ferro-lyase
MKKIASPQELTSELQRLLDYAKSRNPSREKLASELKTLADRVAAKIPDSALDLAMAYADAWSEKAVKSLFAEALKLPVFQALLPQLWDFSLSSQIRSLQFRDNQWMDLNTWQRIATQICPDYNEFNARRVGRWLKGIDSGLKVQMARESSVALYVKGDEGSLQQVLETAEREGRADEYDMKGKELRLWWD